MRTAGMCPWPAAARRRKAVGSRVVERDVGLF